MQVSLIPNPPFGTTFMNILYVEDEQAIAEAVMDILEPHGFECTHVTDGESAWRMWDTQPFQIMLTDLNLPRMTGLELMQRVREACSEIKIVGISGYIEADEIERIKLLGADAVLLKPLTPNQLVDCLKNL
jgi:two-component system capsular synthesis sensor histidine kinase RcsC